MIPKLVVKKHTPAFQIGFKCMDLSIKILHLNDFVTKRPSLIQLWCHWKTQILSWTLPNQEILFEGLRKTKNLQP